MGDRTAQERHLLHARQVNIADEFTLTAQVAGVLLARQPRANSFRSHARLLHAPVPPAIPSVRTLVPMPMT
jgi:hypothetical protein